MKRRLTITTGIGSRVMIKEMDTSSSSTSHVITSSPTGLLNATGIYIDSESEDDNNNDIKPVAVRGL
jgi:hypothetical protein